MSKVYIVTNGYDHGHSSLIGVFSSRKLAYNKILELSPKCIHKKEPLLIRYKKFNVWYIKLTGEYYKIHTMELIK